MTLSQNKKSINSIRRLPGAIQTRTAGIICLPIDQIKQCEGTDYRQHNNMLHFDLFIIFFSRAIVFSTLLLSLCCRWPRSFIAIYYGMSVMRNVVNRFRHKH